MDEKKHLYVGKNKGWRFYDSYVYFTKNCLKINETVQNFKQSQHEFPSLRIYVIDRQNADQNTLRDSVEDFIHDRIPVLWQARVTFLRNVYPLCKNIPAPVNEELMGNPNLE